MVKQMEKACELGNKLKVEFILHLCSQFNHQTLNLLAEIDNNRNHKLSNIEKPKLNTFRIKRGLINLVGRTANVLFGVCDDRDANYLYIKIRELENSKA